MKVRRNFYFPNPEKLKFFIENIIEENVLGYECTQKATENLNIHLPLFLKKHEVNSNKLIIANEIRPSRCLFKNNGTVPCLNSKNGNRRK